MDHSFGHAPIGGKVYLSPPWQRAPDSNPLIQLNEAAAVTGQMKQSLRSPPRPVPTTVSGLDSIRIATGLGESFTSGASANDVATSIDQVCALRA